ncbi:MAG: hypothetical protein JW705_08145 [Methanosarcinaceae archaeon]|nr:hypothetical protein [Methanosarcinaceae archaeon]
MTLPEVCPRDGVSQCKKSECHLYVIDWRTGDEQCIIGYSSTHKKMSRPSPVVDTYAERIRMERGTRTGSGSLKTSHSRSFQEGGSTKSWSEGSVSSETRSSEPKLPEDDELTESEAAVQEPYVKQEFYEKVVSSDKDTTLIESGINVDDSQLSRKKRKSIDDVMDLDLPDNYEEEFWK